MESALRPVVRGHASTSCFEQLAQPAARIGFYRELVARLAAGRSAAAFYLEITRAALAAFPRSPR